MCIYIYIYIFKSKTAAFCLKFSGTFLLIQTEYSYVQNLNKCLNQDKEKKVLLQISFLIGFKRKGDGRRTSYAGETNLHKSTGAPALVANCIKLNVLYTYKHIRQI